MKIIKWPSDFLKKKSTSVTTPPSQVIINEMYKLMRESMTGIGLSAIQVGIPECFMIADVGDGLEVYINPVVTECKNYKETIEGCLSFPGIITDVKRPTEGVVTYQTQDMKLVSKPVNGILLQVILHEIEHMDGKTLADRVSSAVRQNWRSLLRNKRSLK
jgi:peptide deformylase